MKQYIKCFANCIPVKGYKQSFLYDIQRPKASNAIPNDLFEILTEYSDKPIHEIKQLYSNECNEIIDEYFQFLLDEEFAFVFYEEEKEAFLPLDLTWKSPSDIENAIIVLDKIDVGYISKVVKSLSDFRCDAVQFWFLFCPTIEEIEHVIKTLDKSHILTVECVFNINSSIKYEDYTDLRKHYPRLQKLIIGNANEDYFSMDCHELVSKKAINFTLDCGQISPYYFSLNIHTFTEAQMYNTCLNHKLCIDADGNIKNGPAMKQNFGNIQTVTLKKVIEKPEFKKMWYINKDQIDVCKDCEFRYMCTDCRCFIKDPENLYSQPAKCGYNPYICKWNGQEGYIPVEDCGTYSKETGFVPDKEKISNLNKQIWGEDE
jgi:SPASM domain peptide maturase of grasp-with-spasm system